MVFSKHLIVLFALGKYLFIISIIIMTNALVVSFFNKKKLDLEAVFGVLPV